MIFIKTYITDLIFHDLAFHIWAYFRFGEKIDFALWTDHTLPELIDPTMNFDYLLLILESWANGDEIPAFMYTETFSEGNKVGFRLQEILRGEQRLMLRVCFYEYHRILDLDLLYQAHLMTTLRVKRDRYIALFNLETYKEVEPRERIVGKPTKDLTQFQQELEKFKTFCHKLPLAKVLNSFITELVESLRLGQELLLDEVMDKFNKYSMAYGPIIGVTKLNAISRFIDIMLTLGAPLSGHRRKPVWAPLMPRCHIPARKADKLLHNIVGPRNTVYNQKHHADLVKNLNDLNVKNNKTLNEQFTYLRKVYRPALVKGSEEEFINVPNPPKIKIDDVSTKRARILAKTGGDQGIDGIYFYDKLAEERSVHRYIIQGKSLDPILGLELDQAANTLYSKFESHFKDAQFLTPEVGLNYLKYKFSPGVPFMQHYTSRRLMLQDGWYEGMTKYIQEVFETGDYPEYNFHLFPKMQIVSKQKLQEGKPVRSITGSDLPNLIIDYCLFLETSKRTPPFELGTASGLPLNHHGMINHFKAVNARKKQLKMDLVEYDATIPPVVLNSIAYLRSLGFQYHSNARAIKDVIHNRYLRLQRGTIYALESGRTFQKLRGGATGQAMTSDDNTIALKLQLMVTWHLLTHKPYADFWKTNSFINLSDDNLWGFDDDEIEPEKLKATFRALWGQELKIEAFNNPRIANFLGLQQRPGHEFKADFDLLDAKVEPIALVHDDKQLAMRRSATTTLVGSLPEPLFTIRRLQRTVGHMLLSFHNRTLYNNLAEEAANQLNVVDPRTAFNVETDAAGNIITIELRPKAAASRREQHLRNIINKSARPPSYKKVLSIHYTKSDLQKPRKKHSKLVVLNHQLRFVESIHFQINLIKKRIDLVTPDYVTRLETTKDIAPFVKYTGIKDFYLESFIYLMVVHSTQTDIGETEFNNIVRESPYSGVCDSIGFINWLEQPGHKQFLLTQDINKYRNYSILITLIYICLNMLSKELQKTYLSGRLIETFFLFTIDVSKLYSIANLLHWHSTARSSPEIASIIPRDNYIVAKKLARIIASHIDERVYSWWSLNYLLLVLPSITIAGVQLFTWRPYRHALYAGMSNAMISRWDQVADEMIKAKHENQIFDYIISPTGTGKSTYLISVLVTKCKSLNYKLWLCLPRKVLRDNYWLPNYKGELEVVKLKEGIEDWRNADLVVSTYGQLWGRKHIINLDSYLFILDELHEGTPEMLLVSYYLRHSWYLALTATPRNELYAHMKKGYHTTFKKRFSQKVKFVGIRIDETVTALLADEPKAKDRCLVLTPSLAKANEILNNLMASNLRATVISRFNRTIPTTGIIIATQVADSGINIPGIEYGAIDKIAISQHLGKLTTMRSDKAKHEQRIGRIGREDNSIVYCSVGSGTGEFPIQHPSWYTYFESEFSQTLFRSLYGLDITSIPIIGLRKVGCNRDLTYLSNEFRKVEEPIFDSLKTFYVITSIVGPGTVYQYNKMLETGTVPEALLTAKVMLDNILEKITLLPYYEISGLISGNPFITKLGKAEYRHSGLRFEDSVVVSVNHSSARRLI